jgi:uncharacterized protein (DUF433 family)
VQPRDAEEFEGIYEIRDAACYIKATMMVPRPYTVTNRHLIRWIRHGLALPELSDVPGKELVIAFEDLVSMRVVSLLRAIGIGFPVIYRAERWLRGTTGARRPFATELVWTEARNIFCRRESQLVAASLGGQYAILELFRDYLWPVSGLEFNDRKIAVAWKPHDDVVLRPSIQFGVPCIAGTRIPTRAIWGMIRGGDSIDFLSKSYDVDGAKIRHAAEWEQRLEDAGTTAAAA